MIQHVKKCALALVCLVASSCSSTSGISKDYLVRGIENHPVIQKDIQSLIQERSAIVEIEEDDDRSAVISYHEDGLARDIMQVMESKGYYGADVNFSNQENEGVFSIEAGKQASIASIHVDPVKYRPHMQDIDLDIGAPLEASKILSAQENLRKSIQKNSCAYGLKVSHKVALDTQTMEGDLRFIVNQGQPATLGPLTLYGAEKTKESFMRKVIRWQEGECFRLSAIDKAKDKLLATGLFARVEVKLPDDLKSGGQIPVTFQLKERAQRTVKAGLNYYTDEGISASAGWEHRNFFGAGEKVNIDANISTLEQALDAGFSKPYFLRDDQSLELNAFLDREDNDAYEEIGTGFGAAVKRQINQRLSVSMGADFEITEVKEEDKDSKTFGLVKPNASFTYDSRDSSLDPTKGVLLSGGATPFIDVLGESTPFVRTKGSAQGYYSFAGDTVLAGRMKLGSIVGTGTNDVPASERFYVGGGGSVRGFGFQEVGPVNDEGDPAGGRSLFEASTELRYKFTDKIGMVAFADAGHVGEEVVPVLDDLSVGAGLGARYYTNFGPLRFDVGIPLTGKDNTDQNYQIYISIGQAF